MKDLIIEKVKKYDYISFDVFDTLVLRKVSKPSDLFWYVEKRLAEKGFDARDFVNRRIRGEAKAIAENTISAEISLCDIYKNIEFASEEQRAFAISTEQNLEIEFCVANPDIFEVWQFCRTCGKKVIITSDMYLPQETIEAILKKCGYSYDAIFVSSKYGVRKSSGKLYKLIAKELGVQTKEIIHIGDNKRSDYLMPKIAGLASVLYRLPQSSFVPESAVSALNVDSRTIQALKKNYSVGQDSFRTVGFCTLGALLVGFCQWLLNQCKQKQINKILFFARDGYIIQKAFQILYPSQESEYVAISRRSVTVPLLKNAESMEDIVRLVPYIKRYETWETFLHKLGVDRNHPLVNQMKEKYGPSFSKDALLHDAKYVTVFKEIINVVKENALVEWKNAREYLDKFFDTDVAIVDIGWYGTMQQTLNIFYGDSPYKREGFYIGLIKKDGYNPDFMQGYVYDYLRGTPFNEELIYGFNGLIESFFSANHGSTKKYNCGSPVYEEWESENWPIINQVQEGALDFCKEMKKLIDEYDVKIDTVESYFSLERLMCCPRNVEIDLFNKLVFFDTYYEPLVRYAGLKYYLLHPKKIYSDLLASNWKIAYLKKLFKVSCASKIYLFINRIK